MKVFAKSRMEVVAVLVAAVGGAAALAACGSDSATYRPAPRYTQAGPSQPQGTTTYTQPGPAPAPKPTGGQTACGHGMCG